MSRPSKRFIASKWSEWLVPALLVILIVGLLVTLAIVVLSMLHLTPAY
jgi:hypothetical protein